MSSDPVKEFYSTATQTIDVPDRRHSPGKIVFTESISTAKPTILDDAKALVFGPREQDYAHPKVDATRFVNMLNALYADKLKEPFEPADYARIMTLVKLGRSRASLKRDTIIDLAGYAEVLARTVGEDE